jgi:co-chaperonin GroES (HSP10)
MAIIPRPEQEDLIKGKVQIENYQNHSFNLDGWTLTKVLDDILMCQYIDLNDDGTEIKRGNIWVPINAVNFTWRLAKVIIAGPDCKTVNEGDIVVFPNDKGIQVANMNGHKHVVFLNESRIFGVCEEENKKVVKKPVKRL